jgi:hypothetical protein
MAKTDFTLKLLEEAAIPWQKQRGGQARQILREIAAGALASAESFLQGSARSGAAGAFRGVGPASPEETRRQFARLVEWAGQNSRLISPSLAQRLSNIGGVEHETFNDPLSGRWIKLTWPGKAGKEMTAHERQPGVRPTLATVDAPPAGYLRRLALSNEKLGDDIRLHGIIDSAEGVRIVTSQRHIRRGEKAPPEDIARFFTANGFQQINEKTFYHPGENLLVSDAHIGNVFKTPEGDIVPFDVGVQQPEGALRRAVEPASALSFG